MRLNQALSRAPAVDDAELDACWARVDDRGGGTDTKTSKSTVTYLEFDTHP